MADSWDDEDPYGLRPFEVEGAVSPFSGEHHSEPVDVARVASISMMLGDDPVGVAELSREFENLGFSSSAIEGSQGWSEVDAFDSVGRLHDQLKEEEDRTEVWHQVSETRKPDPMVAVLFESLCNELERESATAAAALFRTITEGDPRWRALAIDPHFGYFLNGIHRELGYYGIEWESPLLFPIGEEGPSADELIWDPEQWTLTCQAVRRFIVRYGERDSSLAAVAFLTRLRLSQALRSPDPLTRSLAASVFIVNGQDPAGDVARKAAGNNGRSGATVSTMIHGTWGWKGDWWRPSGDLHGYVSGGIRPDLYGGGMRFGWNGGYNPESRRIAGNDFVEWSDDAASGHIHTLFAHSYGGEVAARAILEGTTVDELVLLSVPVTKLVEQAVNTGLKVVDVRTPVDPVLTLARVRQRLRQRVAPGQNVTEVMLKWRNGHSASHSAHVWQDEDVAGRGSL